MPLIAGFVKFWSAGGWKLFLAAGVAIGLFFAAKYVVDEIKTSGERAQRIIELTEDLNEQMVINNTFQAEIKQQNDDLIIHLQRTQANAATIRQLRDRLDALTIDPTADPTPATEELNKILAEQVACLERVSRGESDATCQ